MDVRRGLHRACLVWVVALLCACGGDEDVIDLRDSGYPDDVRPDAGDGGDAGRRDAGPGMDAATDAGDAGPDIDADVGRLDATVADAGDGGDAGDGAVETRPIVMVLSPSPSFDPEEGPVLTGTSVAVQCAAQGRQGRGIAIVRIAIYQGDETTPKVDVPGNFGGDGGWANTMVSLANITTGRIRIRCTATDDVSDPQSGFDEIQTFYDGGPVVTFDGLVEGKIIAGGGTSTKADLPVKFKVAPARLGASDPDADVSSVNVFLNERPLSMVTSSDGVYLREVDLYTFFNRAPVDRVAVEVVATNRRNVTVRKKVNIQVDGAGPTAEVLTPAPVLSQPPFVGGTVFLSVRVGDALAGLASGAYAIIQAADGEREYRLTPVNADACVEGSTSPDCILGFEFEATSFADKALIVAQLFVTDIVGNLTTIEHTMRVDTVGPWVSLDPPDVRVSIVANTCSGPFDPLGQSPRDGQVIQQQARFRAVVYERATIRPGATELFMSGVRPGSVQFVAQPYGAATNPSEGRQLLVDRDGDTICDTIDDSPLLRGQATPYRVTLQPIVAGGGPPDAEPDMMFSMDPLDPPPDSTCSMPATRSNMVPAARCGGSEMSYVISHDRYEHDPVIFGYAPTAPPAPACTGASLDFGGAAGWYCVTTMARDGSGSEGNLGIAPPIRVCRKLAPGDCGGAPADSIIPVPDGLTCTKECTLPDVWKTPAMPRILVQ